VVRVGLDALAGDDDSATEHFGDFRFALGKKLQLLAFLLVQVEENLLVARR
jgi:hypothetical protein